MRVSPGAPGNFSSSGGGGLSVVDAAAWTTAISAFTPTGGVFNDSATVLSSGQQGTVRLTTNRAIHANLRDASGNQLIGSKTSANSIPIVIASDQASIPVAATLAAETTKVIGTVNQGTSPWVVSNGGTFAVQATLAAETTKVIGVTRTADGAGNLLTSNSTTFTAKFGLDVNILGTLGTSFSTAGKVDVKAADGDVFVRQATASNLNATVVGTGTFVVQATLAAETTKVIGVVRTADGAGNLYTTNSTTYTAKFAQDTNLLGTLGTSFSTAGKVDVKAADGDVFVRQATGSNLHMVVDSGTITTVSTVTNLAQMNGAALLMGNGGTGTGSQRTTIANDNTGIANWGHGATAATAPAGATYAGVRGTTALPTAVSDGQMVGAMGDKFGRQVVQPITVRDLLGTQTTTISASTSETTIVTAGGAGIFNDLVMLIVSNTSAATNTRIDFRDATAGSILFSLISIGGAGPIGFAPATVIPQTTAANNWTAQCATSTTDIRVYAVYAKNK